MVDTSSPLDLCPIPVYPSVQEFKSLMEESEDDYDEEEGQEEADKIRQGDRKGTGYAKQGSNCEECQQIIVDERHRYHPHLCVSCELLKWEAEKIQQGFLLPDRGYAKQGIWFNQITKLK